LSIKDTYRVQSIKKEECKEWFLHKHYAHRMANIIYAFGLYCSNVLCGVCSFGPAPNINTNNIVGDVKVYELNRLVINQDTPKNTLSFFVSKALISLPTPTCIISYADTGRGHHGYIYQATNWIYTGESSPGGATEFEKDGIIYHARNLYGENYDKNKFMFTPIPRSPKHRYFYFLGSKKQKKEMLSKLPFAVLPYPKGDNKRYDASYEVRTQLSLL